MNMGKYDDLINLPHHVSERHKPMSMRQRAAQFAPFAALTGHEDAIADAARHTEAMKEISDEEKDIISLKLKLAIENNMSIKVTYFIPDITKKGGVYKSVYGSIRKWDKLENVIYICETIVIPIRFISDVDIPFDIF